MKFSYTKKNLYVVKLTLSNIKQISSRRWNLFFAKTWKISLKWRYNYWTSWKHWGKNRNCSFWTIFSFVKIFSKVIWCGGVRKHMYAGKCCEIQLQTLWPKDKLFIMSDFSFCHILTQLQGFFCRGVKLLSLCMLEKISRSGLQVFVFIFFFMYSFLLTLSLI